MRVLMLGRDRVFLSPGGDTVQMEETQAALARQGVDVDISTDILPDLSAYDVVHLFSVLDPVQLQYLRFLHSVENGKPVVVSTIYAKLPMGQQEQYLKELRGSWRGIWLPRLSSAFKRTRLGSRLLSWFFSQRARNDREQRWYIRKYFQLYREPGTAEMQARILRGASVMLPNSHAEENLCRIEFGAREIASVIVPNAVNPAVFMQGDAERFRQKYGVTNFVMCAACIYPRKNQLSIIRALGTLDVPVVFAGRAAGWYGEICRREATSRMLFVGQLDQTDLADAYAAAKVHILASWYETPGLANLEAALAGCAIVSMDLPDTREYFGEDAFYCDPFDVASIRDAVARALVRGPRPSLAHRITTEFTWEKAAEKTLEGYELAMSNARRYS